MGEIKYNKKLESCIISYVRIFSMILIFLCHLVQESNSNILNQTAQIFNVGVFIFLFISGFLFGQKKIDNIKKWYIKRGIRILIPLYIFMIGMFILRGIVFNNGIEFDKCINYLFNVQGFFGGILGARHLCFLSTLMICYLITPLLDKGKIIINNIKQCIVGLVVIVGIQLLTCYFINTRVGLQITYVLIYIIAYFISYLWKRKITLIRVLLLDIIAIIFLAIRFFSKNYFDGSILYENIIVIYEQIIFAISIFMTIYYLLMIINKKREISIGKIIKYIDNISFYFYITHYMFLVGPVRVMNLTNNFILNSIIAIFISYILAVLLMKISELTIKGINNENKYNSTSL